MLFTLVNEKGAIVSRISPSFLRFGNYEIFTARKDVENLIDQLHLGVFENSTGKSNEVEFETKDGTVTGVEDVSFEIFPGETVCVVGESGSGKSVSSLSLMRLVEYGGGKITGGKLIFDRKTGESINLCETNQKEMSNIRGNEIGMIFQEPMTALNPVLTVERQLTEGLRFHKKLSKKKAIEKALEILKQVRLPEPEKRLKQLPTRAFRWNATEVSNSNGNGL